MDDYADRRITVMGLGAFGGGAAAARFFAERGAKVTVTDLRETGALAGSLEALDGLSIDYRLGGHDKRDFTLADLIVVNPAVKRDHPLLAAARARGVSLTSEMNLFWRHNRGRVAAVTGSNGKSTTTALLHAMLAASGRRAWLGGNIGRSLLPHVDEITDDDWVALELSSFQLADLNRLRAAPDVAVVTNFTPNHLDWHGTVAAYRRAKQTILRWQTPAQTAVLNGDDAEVSSWPTKARTLTAGLRDSERAGLFLEDGVAVARRGALPDAREFPLLEWIRLPGRHNLQNALLAGCAALAIGARPEDLRTALLAQTALSHRLERVGQLAGRHCYNDSLATTPESTIAALESFTAPIVLLAGGSDKKIDLTPLARAIAGRAKAVALLGETGPELGRLIRGTGPGETVVSPPCASLSEAVDWALAESAPGDVVLLSPGCASYDWFPSFAARGEEFTRLVRVHGQSASRTASTG